MFAHNTSPTLFGTNGYVDIHSGFTTPSGVPQATYNPHVTNCHVMPTGVMNTYRNYAAGPTSSVPQIRFAPLATTMVHVSGFVHNGPSIPNALINNEAGATQSGYAMSTVPQLQNNGFMMQVPASRRTGPAQINGTCLSQSPGIVQEPLYKRFPGDYTQQHGDRSLMQNGNLIGSHEHESLIQQHGGNNKFSSQGDSPHFSDDSNQGYSDGGYNGNGGRNFNSKSSSQFNINQGYTNSSDGFSNRGFNKNKSRNCNNNGDNDGFTSSNHGYIQQGDVYPHFPNNNFDGNKGKPRPRITNTSGQTYSSIVCQICEKQGHGAYNCYYRNSQQQQEASSSLVVCQICDKPGHSAYKCYHRNSQLPPASKVAASPQLSSLTQSPLVITPASNPISNHKAFVSAIPDSTLLHCRQTSHSMLCQALPLIPPG
ncbi:hypothetical protein ABKV19_027644 [Rosa sericea]